MININISKANNTTYLTIIDLTIPLSLTITAIDDPYNRVVYLRLLLP